MTAGLARSADNMRLRPSYNWWCFSRRCVPHTLLLARVEHASMGNIGLTSPECDAAISGTEFRALADRSNFELLMCSRRNIFGTA
jgi:hypothetical protein